MSIIQGLLGSIGGSLPPNYYLGLSGNYGEGYTLSLSLSYEYATGQTVYWSIATNTATQGVDYTSDNGYSGSLSPTGTGSQQLANITHVADNTTEGTEYYYIRIGTNPGGNDLYENNININDLSTDPLADFTIEWWQKMSSSQNNAYPRLFDIGSYPNEKPGISFENGSTVIVWGAGYDDRAYAVNFEYNTWVHWAIVRHNNTIALYKNGVSQLNTNNLGNRFFDETTSPLTIGTGSGTYWYGKVTDFHWIKGTAKYTSNFWVERRPAPAIANSKLLLRVANSGNKLVDSATGKTVYEYNTVAFDTDTPWLTPSSVTATLSGVGNTLGVFGSPPSGFDNIKPAWTISRVGGGWSSTVVAIPAYGQITAADNWLNDAADYTFSPPSSITHYSNAGSQYLIQFDPSYTDLQNVKAGWSVTSSSYSAIVLQDAYLTQGAYWVRVSVDWAPGTFVFTPPTQTGSLVFNGSNVGLDHNDDWALDVYGRSLSFNGSQARWVKAGDNPGDWNLGNTYTIEWWEKVPNSSGFYSVMCQQDADNCIDIFHNAGFIGAFNGQLTFAEPTVGQWNHIVIQKDGTTATAYVNGVLQTLTTNNASTLSNNTLDLAIGFRTSDGGNNFYTGQQFNGYLTNIRISNVARYSGAFTPPLTLTVDSNTKLALSGAPGSAGPLDDVSPNNHTITYYLTQVAYTFPSLP